MSTSETYLAIMARVETLSVGSPALPIAYPEMAETFVPPDDGKYLDATAFPNKPFWEGLAEGRIDQGILQITVVWPKNVGLAAPMAAADEVIAHFPKGHRMGAVKVSGEGWQSPPLPGDDAVRIPVTIPWRG